MSESFTTPRRFVRFAAVIAVLAAPAGLSAQSATEHIALGDKDHAAMNAPSALRHYEEAIKADPRSYEALWKATREAVDVGEYNPDEKERDRLYTSAEQYARRAVDANPGDAEGHFMLAKALGRKALSLGKRDQVKYAGDVRSAALDCLKINPKHDGCMHVIGKWNYEIMGLNGLTRMFAKTFLGGKVFNAASLDSAQIYMESATAAAPIRIVHHLDLGRVYAKKDMKDKAKAEFETAIKLTPIDFNDRKYQEEARKELEDVR